MVIKSSGHLGGISLCNGRLRYFEIFLTFQDLSKASCSFTVLSHRSHKPIDRTEFLPQHSLENSVSNTSKILFLVSSFIILTIAPSYTQPVSRHTLYYEEGIL